MSLAYSIREGFAGLRRARLQAFASTSAMTAALVLIGLFAMLTWEASQVSTWLRQRVGEFEMFLHDAIEDDEADALYLRVSSTRGVSEAEFISRSQAQAVFREEFGEGAEVFLDEPFLPPSIRVRMEPAYVDSDSLAQLVTELQSWEHVDEVVFNRGLLIKVEQNLRVLTLFGLLIGAFVVLVSIFLVGNTIRLTMHARRLLIRTMKLVGATERFIRRPFVIEGMAQGFLAGALAASMLWGSQAAATAWLPQLDAPSPYLTLAAAGGLSLCGMMLGWLGARVAFRRVIEHMTLH